MPVVRLSWRLLGLLVLIGGLGGLGCNVYGGLDPSATSVERLLADARIALTTGHPQRAVRLLETAYERDSTDVAVRVELANALYAVRDVDVFALRAAVQRLNGKGAPSKALGSKPLACTDGTDSASPPDRFRAVALDEALQALAGHRAQLRRVSRLLITGVLNARSDAFAAAPIEVQSTGYLLAALTRMGRRLLGVRAAARATESTLYRDPGADPPALVACSPTAEGRRQMERELCRLRDGTRQALSWLRSRNDRTSSRQTGLLIDVLTRHRDALDDGLSCTTASRSRAGTLAASSQLPVSR